LFSGLYLQVLACLFQGKVTLLIGPSGTEPNTDKGGPRAAFEHENGEDDAEAEAEGGLDEEIRETTIPLFETAVRRGSFNVNSLLYQPWVDGFG